MFLPFLTALSAEFGRIKEKAGKHPKVIKRGEFQDRKSKEKNYLKGRFNSKQDKGWAHFESYPAEKHRNSNALRDFSFGTKIRF